jgi:Dolichyl-phosphate-mannose-protein mannosyltransferase
MLNRNREYNKPAQTPQARGHCRNARYSCYSASSSQIMTNARSNGPSTLILLVTALLPRILGAALLPNAFGDAYVYIQEIGALSTKISNGTFRLTDLFGFWLPLYQLISAIVNVFVKNGFYSGKIIAALFGAGTCGLVYLLTKQLTNDRKAAFWIFLLIAVNPLHVFYSASAMTDVPHAFFVLAALYFALTGNWIVAAMFGAFAGFTRVESWMLIALLPLAQLIKERRISIAALLILILPPIFWFYISWKATGNWLECFVQRQQYHDWLLQVNPAIAHFSLINVLKDTAMLLVSSDVAVLIASFIAGWFVLRLVPQFIKGSERHDNSNTIVAPVMFFFAFFALLLVAYLTHQQPIIFPRYGLILFMLGLPILPWTFLKLRMLYPQFARKILVSIVVICALDAAIQFAGAVGLVNQYRAQRAVADYLRDHFDSKSDARVFCDDGTVRILSGIREDRFVASVNAPKDREGLLTFLDQNNVDYVIVIETGRSTPFELYPSSAEYNEQIGRYESIMDSRTAFIHTIIHVYRRNPRRF